MCVVKNYLNKIDTIIQSQIHILANDDSDFLECIIYVKDFNLSKKFFLEYRPIILEIIHEYPFVNAFGVRIKTDNLTKLAQLSQIVYISSQTTINAQVLKSKQTMNIQSLYKQGFTGKGVCVAVLDTGISPHIDFLYPHNRVLVFKDFIQNKNYMYDDNGHGTIVAGIIGGNGIFSNKVYSGIAPNVKLVILKCLNKFGQTTTIEMLNAMQWLYNNKRKFNINIACMSFGANPVSQNDPLIKGAEALWNQGITVVSAGGNSGPEYYTIKSPGASQKIITVGSLNDGRHTSESDDKLLHSYASKNVIIPTNLNISTSDNTQKKEQHSILKEHSFQTTNNRNIFDCTNNKKTLKPANNKASFYNQPQQNSPDEKAQTYTVPDFSSRGPAFGLYKPDLLAPGVDIISTNNQNGYSKMSGTSVSTPLVAGVCALLVEKYNHSITSSQIKELLMNTCVSLSLDRNTEGLGYLYFS